MSLLAAETARIVAAAIDEDLAHGPDITTDSTIASDATGVADIVARAPGTVAGSSAAVGAFTEVARRRGESVEVQVISPDGTRVGAGDTVLTVTGSVRLILTAERTALNLLSQLSGVATLTARWVDALSDTGVRVRDTRKTVPGMRLLQKAAVVAGGGVNHRLALGDAALIKDNHVVAAGSVAAAFRAVRDSSATIPVEVECDTVEQVREALEVGADLVLLDNMEPALMRECVELAEAHRQAGGHIELEASGGITVASARQVAQTGVDLIAVGELTHSAPVLDLGLDLRGTYAGP